MKYFRMGVDPRPDWFTVRVTDNKIITYSDDPDQGPFSFKRTYCDIRSDSGEILKANFGDYILWYGNEHFAVVSHEQFIDEFRELRMKRD
jgi:hypothetical protein